MKALTIKQPYASLIISGVKKVENRTWNTKFRGWIIIHAAQSTMPLDATDEQWLSLKRAGLQADYYTYNNHKSQIVGVAYIKSVDEQMKTEWDVEGQCHWRISKIYKFRKPIKGVKGHLSLWEFKLPVEYIQELKEQGIIL